MTKFEALSKLGLNINATDEQIKIAYRTLVKKYHPDQFIEGSLDQKQAEEKMKEINEAKNTLDKMKKNGEDIPFYQSSKNYQQYYMDIEKYKRKMVEKLSRYNSNINNISELDEYYDKINMIILSFAALLFNVNNITLVNSFYDTCKDGILKVFDKLKKELFKKYDIDESKITETINYECNLEEFYKQLLKIKEKYDLKEIYRKKIEQDLSDYKLRAGYDYLKGLIEISIDNILKRLKRNNYTNYEEELNKGKEEIDKIFEDYFSYLTQFNQIQEFLEGKNLDDAKIAEIYSLFKSAWNSFNEHISLYDTGENLKKINSLIEEYKKYQQHLIEYNEFISYASSSIINNYQNALNKFTLNNLEKARLATATLSKICEIIGKIKSGAISVDKGKLLFEIKFESFDEDEKILNKIRGLDDSKGIYVLNNRGLNFGEVVIGIITKETDDYVVIQGIENISNNFKEKRIGKAIFKKMYMPLHLWLLNSNFSGMNSANYLYNIILYYNTQLCICYNEINDSINFRFNSTTTGKYNPDMEKFKNISYMIDKIEETLQKTIQNAKEQTRKRGKIH